MMKLGDDGELNYDGNLRNLYLVKKVAGAWPGLMYTSLCQVPFKITLKLDNVVERRYLDNSTRVQVGFLVVFYCLRKIKENIAEKN